MVANPPSHLSIFLTPVSPHSNPPQPPDNTRFKFGYLTKQNAIWSTLGLNLFGASFSPVDQVKDTDQLFVVGYPSFNPREELSATYQLWKEAAEPTGRCLYSCCTCSARQTMSVGHGGLLTVGRPAIKRVAPFHQTTARPLIVFNGELDRIRGGYYPAFAFGELAKLSKTFIPNVSG